jgi:hypothetical protein
LGEGCRVTVVDRFFFGRGTLPADRTGLACADKDTRAGIVPASRPDFRTTSWNSERLALSRDLLAGPLVSRSLDA